MYISNETNKIKQRDVSLHQIGDYEKEIPL